MSNALWKACVVVSFMMGLSGMSHGLFEVLQGTAETGGPGVISAIGPDHRMWIHGDEAAFTILPTFLASGITSILMSAALLGWSLVGLRRRGGAHVHLALFVLLFLFGGGIAQAPFFLVLWGFATLIPKPTGVRRPGGLLARVWKPLLAGFIVLMTFALQAAITGAVPFVPDEDLALTVVLLCVAVALVASPLVYLGARAADRAA